MTNSSIEATIAECEEKRCRALVNKNLDALAALIPDELIHVHANGHVEDKASYLATVSERIDFLKVTRDKLSIRVVGDVAVASGILDQRIRVVANGAQVDMHLFVTQLWRQSEGTWKQYVFQATTIT